MNLEEIKKNLGETELNIILLEDHKEDLEDCLLQDNFSKEEKEKMKKELIKTEKEFNHYNDIKVSIRQKIYSLDKLNDYFEEKFFNSILIP